MARWYRTVWYFGTVLMGTLGIWLALTAWPGVWNVFIFVAATVGFMVLVIDTDENIGRRLRRASSAGLVSGAAVIAAGGLVAFSGGMGVLVVVMLVVSSPHVLARVSRWTEGRGGRSLEATLSMAFDSETLTSAEDAAFADSEQTSALEALVAPAPQAMDDLSLCMAWRKSYVALQRPMSLAVRTRLIQRRQEYMDEFERRNPQGFEAWLASGARAAGDPTRFIVSADGQSEPDQ